MTLRLGDTAPDFKAETTEGPISFHDYISDSWAILFSHPKDFTPVCTTELGLAAQMKPEFDARNVKLIALSVDSIEDHKGWALDIAEVQGCALNFPIISDADKSISEKYGMIHPNENETLTVRTVFVVGPDKQIKLMITYPMATGRNFDEILRVIDSLQLTAEHKVATPAGWKEGEDVIVIPSISDDEAKQMFSEGFRAEKPYLRFVQDPRNKKAQAA